MPQPKKKTTEYIEFLKDYKEALLDGRPVNEIAFRKVFNDLTKLKQTDDPEVYTALGMAACLQNDIKKSKKYHQTSINISSHPNRYLNFAISMFYLKDMKTAMVNCEKAIELQPMHPGNRVIYLDILEYEGKIEEAKTYAENLLEGDFEGNHELIDRYDDLLDYNDVMEARKILNDPTTKYLSTEEVMARLEV